MSSTFIRYTYNTTALRLAAVFTAQDLGALVVDNENGSNYRVIATGSGVACMSAEQGTYGYIKVPLGLCKECDANGDVGDLAAHGGILASDSTPAFQAAATTEQAEIAWVASNSDAIVAEVPVPEDFDGTQAVLAQAQVVAGTTDAFSATIDTTWAGGTLVADTLAGSALATVHQATATIAAADVADSPDTVTIKITPGAHTTDAFLLRSLRLRYVRKS